ncbi:MAG: ABC transporter substrate-binding protein [Oscillospiraceae bacterium]|nr:ABC transporter substrate-binding protein [Oscillospiraceae bacterium]MDD4369292.1 ABC transporter substrate-binding protein [Oscillospiraceae bacterium]
MNRGIKGLHRLAATLTALSMAVMLAGCTSQSSAATTTNATATATARSEETSTAATTASASAAPSDSSSAETTAEASTSASGTVELVDQSFKIGIMQLVEHNALDAAKQGFVDGLAALGIVEGQNLTIDFENAQNDQSNAQTIAQQFAADTDIDLVLAIATPVAQAAVNAITDRPILVTAVTDPAASGLVESNDAPGGNLTGTSDLNPVKEQMQLLTELVPDAKTVGIMYSSSEANSEVQAKLAETEAQALGLETEIFTASASNEIQQVVESAVGKVDALYIPTDNTFASSMAIVGQVAEEAKLPVIAGEENMMEAGALATVSLDYYKLGQQTADMAYEILVNGKDPATMPIEYQSDPVLAINQDFADAIGLTIPDSILAEVGK